MRKFNTLTENRKLNIRSPDEFIAENGFRGEYGHGILKIGTVENEVGGRLIRGFPERNSGKTENTEQNYDRGEGGRKTSPHKNTTLSEQNRYI